MLNVRMEGMKEGQESHSEKRLKSMGGENLYLR